MTYQFDDYIIHIGKSNNHPGKFVASIEEFYNVIIVVDNESEAKEKLRTLFEKEIKRLNEENKPTPIPGSGKAKIKFAPSDKIQLLRPFIDDFWGKILGTTYSTSFVSNESLFRDWEHYLKGGKQELIDKVKRYYHRDISSIYDKPICEILSMLRKRESILTKLKKFFRKQ